MGNKHIETLRKMLESYQSALKRDGLNIATRALLEAADAIEAILTERKELLEDSERLQYILSHYRIESVKTGETLHLSDIDDARKGDA